MRARTNSPQFLRKKFEAVVRRAERKSASGPLLPNCPCLSARIGRLECSGHSSGVNDSVSQASTEIENLHIGRGQVYPGGQQETMCCTEPDSGWECHSSTAQHRERS